MPFSRSRYRSSSIGIFIAPSSRSCPRSCPPSGASPRQHHLPLADVWEWDGHVLAADVEGHGVILDRDDDALDLAGLVGGGQGRALGRGDPDRVALLAAEVARGGERPVEPGRADLQDVAAGQRVLLVEGPGEPAGDLLDDLTP